MDSTVFIVAMAPHAPSDFTLNGIVADPAGRYLPAVEMHAGELFRIDLTPNAIGQIRKVALRGGELTFGDGTTATLDARFTDESLALPTTLVRVDDRILVASSQFDKGGPLGPGTPKPFAVLAVAGI
ncbi:hypothetical protein [Nocardia brasiliensis]|uniref:hypothetical protein n=1 Tax=Nocardia brasiliensis TaxID=37326 RepID=UPI002456FAE0|nr:hypothetical protein [Nocardia brasiliensis]